MYVATILYQVFSQGGQIRMRTCRKRHPAASMKVAVLGYKPLISLWSSQKYRWTLSVARWPYHWRILHCLSAACENRSYPKVVPWTDFSCQNWSTWTTFGCQRWSPLAKTCPGRTKFGNQNWSGGPLLAAESGSSDPVWVAIRMVLLPYSDCWEGWICIASNLHKT